MFGLILSFLSVNRMSDSYIYDEYSCLDELIHGESATAHLLLAEYMTIKFHLGAVDVSFSVFVLKCIINLALQVYNYLL